MASDWCYVNVGVQRQKYQNSTMDNAFAKKRQVSGNKLFSLFF